MAIQIQKKQFLFFRRLPPYLQGEYGGLEKLMFDWFERIDYSKISVIVVVTKGWKERFLKEAQQRRLSLEVFELPFDYFHVGPMKRFFDMYQFLNQFKPYGIILFQAHFEEFGLPELIAASIRTNGNVFMHENTGSLKPPECSTKKHFGFLPGLGLWWVYYMMGIKLRAYISKNILAVSQEIKNRYVNWWGYPASKVHVSYHGVDSKKFYSDPQSRKHLRKELNIPENDTVFINLARFTPLKRIDRGIKAFDLVFQKSKNIHLVLVGSGPLENECRQLASGLSCGKNIHFIGHVDNPADYLRMADAFVLTSDNEGLSIALMEAMASGLIAVSTDCTGSNEVITEGKTGFIVEKTDESVAQGMQKALMLSMTENQEMKQSAVRFIQDHFDIDCNVKNVFQTLGVRD